MSVQCFLTIPDFNRNAGDSSASGNLCAVNDTPTIETNSDLVSYIPEVNEKGEHIVTVDLVSGAVNIKQAPNGGWYGAAHPRKECMAIGD